ncbi:MAG: hypothetical protein QOI58_2356 [Thermoanaerobaculia bacterium]|jgi:RNA polymerase sigma factor (sigma-70 family)|nr:hypothetical protein [Thermoanaerobaculia bacterium]
MDPETFFLSQLSLIDRAIAFVCRKYHLSEQEAEDFESLAKLKLIEDDYRVIRRFEGRSHFATYLTVVVQRFYLDFKVLNWGKWRPSAQAKSRGPVAVMLERLIRRDGYSFSEASRAVANQYPLVTLDELREMYQCLPSKGDRGEAIRRTEDIEAAVGSESLDDNPLQNLERSARHETAVAVGRILKHAISRLDDEDRLIMHLRFEEGLKVPQIARSLGADQKQLYRRIGRILDGLRRELLAQQVDEEEVRAIISGGELDDESFVPNVRTIKSADAPGVYVDPGTARRTLRELLREPRQPKEAAREH